jgi:hypothetical protein
MNFRYLLRPKKRKKLFPTLPKITIVRPKPKTHNEMAPIPSQVVAMLDPANVGFVSYARTNARIQFTKKKKKSNKK